MPKQVWVLRDPSTIPNSATATASVSPQRETHDHDSKRIYRAQTGKHGLRRDRSTADTPGFPGAVDFHQRRRLANRKRSASANRGGQAARLHTACGTALPRPPSRLQLPRSGRRKTRKIYQRLQYTWREKGTLRSAFERQRKRGSCCPQKGPWGPKRGPAIPT